MRFTRMTEWFGGASRGGGVQLLLALLAVLHCLAVAVQVVDSQATVLELIVLLDGGAIAAWVQIEMDRRRRG